MIAVHTPREHLARQFEREGRAASAARIRRGEVRSEAVLRALRAIAAAQAEALGSRSPTRKGD